MNSFPFVRDVISMGVPVLVFGCCRDISPDGLTKKTNLQWKTGDPHLKTESRSLEADMKVQNASADHPTFVLSRRREGR